MSYAVYIAASAEKQYSKFPSLLQSRFEQKILLLSKQPRPFGAQKLQGTDYYRMRVGDYRMIYQIEDAAKVVTVLDFGHRRDVYKKY